MSNWDDIRFFLAVARAGSLSGAAKVLEVNHSTVSRRIATLEKNHGVRLFNRVRDGYEMSDAAYSIYEQALAVETQNQQISRALFAQDSRLSGPINLTMPHDIFEHCLAPHLAQFAQQHPDIKLNLLVTKQVRNLASLEADLAIRLTPKPPEYLVGKKVAQLQHGIYGATDLPVQDKVGLVVWQGETQLPNWAQQHFPKAHIALQVDDLTAMFAAVKAGFGIARMPCYLPDSLGDNSVTRFAIELAQSNWGVWVLNHVDLRKTARVQSLREFLIAELQQKQKLFEGVSG